MSVRSFAILLFVGVAIADLGQKGYSPKYNIKKYGNPSDTKMDQDITLVMIWAK